MTTTYKLQGTDENGNVILVSNNTGIVSEKNSTFENLQDAFKAFLELDFSSLEDGCFFELVKLNEDGEVEDWTNEELDSIGWERNSWITKYNS
jgi:hypothetical protein